MKNAVFRIFNQQQEILSIPWVNEQSVCQNYTVSENWVNTSDFCRIAQTGLSSSLSPGYTCYICTRTDNPALLLHVAVTVKPERCTCRQGQDLQQNHWDNVAEYLSN